MTETQGTGYTLTLSDAEVQRYRMMAQIAKDSEADIWQLAGISTGARVGDIGCGPGAMLPALAESVGASGSVVGVDGDAQAVAAAQALVAAAGLANVSVQQGRAEDTGLEPGSLDAVMMRHVLAHNQPTEQAIVDHLAALVRPGGTVFLLDIFAPGMTLRPAVPEVVDIFDKYEQFHALRGNDLRVGTRLDKLLTNAGLDLLDFRGTYVIVTPPPGTGIRPPAWAAREQMRDAGIITDDDIAQWDRIFTERDADPPMLFNPVFTAVGRKPA